VRRSYLLAAIAFLALAAVWHFSVAPRLTIRVPKNAIFVSKHAGVQTNVDPKTGTIPERDVLTTYDRVIGVVDTADWPRSLVVSDRYTARDSQTGAINFEHAVDERIDPRTGAWADGPYKGQIVFFPRNVQKRTYIVRSNYVASVPVKFSGVQDVGGLETYAFAYKGPMDFTAAFAGTPESPGIKVLAGQAILCADDQFYYSTLIEPRTGSQVHVEEGCPSGDFVYDKATGKKVAAVDRWSGVTTGNDLAARIAEVYKARRAYMFETVYVPAILLMGAAGILALGWSRRREKALA
jgi:DUF3068 family protein